MITRSVAFDLTSSKIPLVTHAYLTLFNKLTLSLYCLSRVWGVSSAACFYHLSIISLSYQNQEQSLWFCGVELEFIIVHIVYIVCHHIVLHCIFSQIKCHRTVLIYIVKLCNCHEFVLKSTWLQKDGWFSISLYLMIVNTCWCSLAGLLKIWSQRLALTWEKSQREMLQLRSVWHTWFLSIYLDSQHRHHLFTMSWTRKL